MPKAFLFDLDGTLQDTEVLYVEAWRRAHREKGYPVSDEGSCDMVYARAKDEVCALFCARFPAAYTTPASLEEPLARHFNALRSARDVRIPGSIELLNRLAERYPVAIVSGNSRQDVAEAVAALGIGSKLAFFLGQL